MYPVTRTPLEVPAASIVTGSQLMRAISGDGPCSSCTSRGASGGPAGIKNIAPKSVARKLQKSMFYIQVSTHTENTMFVIRNNFDNVLPRKLLSNPTGKVRNLETIYLHSQTVGMKLKQI